MNQVMNTKLKDESKHKISPQCINKCIEWKLTASIPYGKTSLAYSFNGKSLFFRKLEASILNVLHNNYGVSIEKTPSKNYLKTFVDQSNSQLSEQAIDQNNENGNDILNVKFPINNTEFNYMIIDANLGINENLINIFFLEFDLTNSPNSKEHLKIFREINNECVEREIFFVLNGSLHGTPLFKSDLKFSVESRKFIKSIQFKLETYKNERLEKKKSLKKFNVGGVRNTFYTKILSNINIAIEFYKPTHGDQQQEYFPTNFNSIVNSNITINKIYLELCIPKIFINSGLSLSVVNTKKTSIKGMGIQIEDKIFTNEKYVPVIPVIPFAEKPHSTYSDNDFQKLKTKMGSTNQLSPKQMLRNNNMNLNMNCPQSNYRSPDFISRQNNFNNNYGNFNANVYFSPNYPFSNLSPNSMTYSMPPNIYGNSIPTFPMMNQTLGGMVIQRKLSEHTSDKLMENPLSNFSLSNAHQRSMNKTLNIIKSPPVYMKMNQEMGLNNINPMNSYVQNLAYYNTVNINPHEEGNYTNLVNNGFVSPRGVSNLKLGVELGLANPNPVVPTIHKKIQDWEKVYKKEPKKTGNMFSPGGVYEEDSQFRKRNYMNSQNVQVLNLQAYSSYNDGLCNLLIFLKCSTPYIIKKESHLIKQMSLKDFFQNFTRISVFGLDVSYIIDNEIANYTYSCTLSSMEIIIKDKDTILTIIDKLIHLNKCTSDIKSIIGSEDEQHKVNYFEFSISDLIPNFKIVLKNYQTVAIEYYEMKPPHSRLILIKQLEQLMNIFDVMKGISLMKIDQSSWFAFLWSPFKSTKGLTVNSSFLVYYQFYSIEESSGSGKETNFAEIPIIGLLPIKFDNKIFLQKISKTYRNGTGYNSGMNIPGNGYFGESSQNGKILKSAIDNVHNLVIKKSLKSSIDYDYYLKSSLSGFPQLSTKD